MVDFDCLLRPRLQEQIKHTSFAQICPELLHTDRELEQLKEVLFAHVNAALEPINIFITLLLFAILVESM